MSKQPIYGFPCVEDPNDFIPDGESCSPAELEAHRLACATFGTPDYQTNKGCYTEHDADGRFVMHVLRTSWGIGTNLIESCDGCQCPAPLPGRRPRRARPRRAPPKRPVDSGRCLGVSYVHD